MAAILVVVKSLDVEGLTNLIALKPIRDRVGFMLCEELDRLQSWREGVLCWCVVPTFYVYVLVFGILEFWFRLRNRSLLFLDAGIRGLTQGRVVLLSEDITE